MPHDAQALPVAVATSRQGRIRLVFPADMLAVRQALKAVLAHFAQEDFEPEELGSLELALAEVLNNVVEHAYADRVEGEIELSIARGARGLYCEIRDDGREMPDGTPPAGITVNAATPLAEMPEGGFGWFLIREITHDLRYIRMGAHNRLSFRLAIGISECEKP